MIARFAPSAGPRRRGAALVAALVCLLVVSSIVGHMAANAVRARRQLHVERDRRQTELLLEAGLDRAAMQLARDPEYRGETWDLPADQILGGGAGEVNIEAVRGADDGPWQVRVVAEYPVGGPASVRRSREFEIQSASLPNGAFPSEE